MNYTIPGEARAPREAVTDTGTLRAALPTRQERKPSAYSRQVAHGTIWSVAGRVAALLASFVSTPFLTRLLGAEQYGIWALANTLNTYLTFTDLGMGIASTKFAAGYYARKDDKGEVAVVWTSLLITLVPVMAGMLFVMIWAGPLVEVSFGVPPHLQIDAMMVLQLTALGFVARAVANVLNTPQLVRLRLDWFAMLSTGLLIVQHGAIVIVLLLGGGLRGAIWMVTSCSLLTAITYALASRTLQPALFRPRIDVTLIRPLLRFGSGVILSALLGNIVLANLERLFLAHFGSVRDLGYYSVAASLAGLLALVPGAISQPLLPALSALHAAKEKIMLQHLCVQALRAILLCMLPAALLLCTAAEPLLRYWAGPEYALHSTIPFYILMAGVTFNSIVYVPYNLLTASGRTGTIAKCHLAETVPYVFGAVFLTSQFGIAGAALTWSLRMLIATILFIAVTCRVTDFPLRALLKGWQDYGIALFTLVGVGTISFCLAANPFVRLALAATGCIGYGGVVWTAILSVDERESILRFLHLHTAKES